MAQESDLVGFTPALAPNAPSADRTPDALAIFSAPGVGVVMQWWAESNRRWAEQNRLKPMLAYPEQKAVK